METLNNYMTSDALVDMLVAKVATGGNLLLDIGPTADGRIPVIMEQRLLDIGAWLKVNGEAIYGTISWKKAPSAAKDQTVFYTSKGSDLYVICTRWPDKATVVPGLKKAAKVTLLGSMLPVKSGFSGGKLTITPPALNPANNPCDYAWVFKIAGVL
jgi:alpha-L-fucosidase